MAEQSLALPEILPDNLLPAASGEPLRLPPGVPEADGGSGGLALGRYLDALRRYKWFVLILAILGVAIGGIAARFAMPQYQAQATLWVEVTPSKAAVNQGPIRSEELLESAGWVQLLRSFVVLDHVVRTRQLYLQTDPRAKRLFSGFDLAERFRPGAYVLKIAPGGRSYALLSDHDVQLEEGQVGDSIGAALGFRWAPAPGALPGDRALEFVVHTPRDISVDLGQALRSSMQEKAGNFLGLSLQGPDPAETAATVNAVAERFTEVAAQLKRSKLEQLTAVLDEQRRVAEDNLRSAELGLESFRVSTITLPTDKSTPVAPGLEITRDPVMSRFFDMKVQREQLRTDREAIERVLAQARGGELPADALGAIPAVQASPALLQALQERVQRQAELRALQQRYTTDYRPVQQLTQTLNDLDQVTIPQLAGDVRAQLVQREEELDARIGSASSELQAIPPRALEEARLERRVAIAENLHTTLKQRYEEARLAAASTVPDISVLDRAVVPTKPISDTRLMMVLMGLLGGLGLGVAGVVVMDRVDPRVRYPEQVTGGLGLPILGVIPNVGSKVRGGDRRARLHAAEAFRELRLNLLHAHGAGPLIVAVTSPASGDGKSFITANLAAALADQGFRTAVIDGDTRRGALHRILGGTRAPGLADHLASGVSLLEVTQATSIPSVDLIASGTRIPSSPELLSSGGFAKMLVALRAQYDAILIDCPPLGAGVDAYAISMAARDAILVVRTGNTNKAFAEAKLGLLDRLPVRLLGAVLNGTPASHVYQYYSYLPGYEAQEEGAEADVPRLEEGEAGEAAPRSARE